MAERGMAQRELASALGVSIDRVKSLTSGRVKKLAPEEIRAFVERLGVRAEYLATGERPVFRPGYGTSQGVEPTPDAIVPTAEKGVSEPMPAYFWLADDEVKKAPLPARKAEPDAWAELGLLERAVAISDQALEAAQLRTCADSDQYAALCVVAFSLLARKVPKAEVRKVIDRVLAIGRGA
jgi:transcriptional regulator with XRE-family HTH domain